MSEDAIDVFLGVRVSVTDLMRLSPEQRAAFLLGIARVIDARAGKAREEVSAPDIQRGG